MNANKSVSTFTFVDHCVNKLTVNNNIFSLSDDKVDSRELDVDYRILNIVSTDDFYQGELELTVSIIIKGRSEAKKNSKFSSKVTVTGFFLAPLELGEEKFRSMLCLSGTSTLYSIVRSTLISVSAQCAVSGVARIPLLNMHAFNEAKLAKELRKFQKQQQDAN